MNVKLAIVGAVVVVLGILSLKCLFVVDQTEQALVLQFGDPRRVVREPGLHVMLPWQDVLRYDNRADVIKVSAPNKLPKIQGTLNGP